MHGIPSQSVTCHMGKFHAPRKHVQAIKMFGVTVTNGLSLSLHVQSVRGQTLCALRFLCADCAHGLRNSALQTIYNAVVIAKLTYASSAWMGFTTANDRQKQATFIFTITLAMWIILLLLHSLRNNGRRSNEIYHLPSNLLPHYLGKF